MIRFDKLKISVPLSVVSGYEDNPKFEVAIKNGEILRYSFSNTLPLLHLSIYPAKGIIMEFTGKILMEQYADLINESNIMKCLMRVEEMSGLTIDKVRLCELGDVLACDVTQDLAIEDLPSLLNIIETYKKTPQWMFLHYTSDGYALEKIVKTPRCKRRLLFYDKAKELQKSKNIQFLNSLSNGDEVRNYFSDKTRVELNLTSSKPVRNVLKISDNKVWSVLQSQATPLYDILMEALQLPKEVETYNSVSDFQRGIILKYYKNDMERLKVDLLPYYKNVSGANKEVAKIRKVAPIAVPFNIEWLRDLFKESA